MGPWVLLAASASLCMFFGYRSIVLEERLGRLSERLGADAARSQEPAGSSQEPARTSHEARLEALENKASELRGRVELAKLQTAIASGGSRQVLSRVFYSENLESKILGAVRQKQEQKLDETLPLIRRQLVAAREGGLAMLTHVAHLTEAERRSLDPLMKNEAQALVDVFRDADMREDPEAAIAHIRSLIAQTDARARTMLSDEKMKLYLMGRAHEQRMLMPWLESTDE